MSDSFRVLLTDHPWPGCEVESAILAECGGELIDAPQQDEETLSNLAREVEAIMTCWAQVTPQVIRAADRLKIVARLGIGLDNISIPTASERGVPVTNVPDYCVSEVSDHALALILACGRKIGFFHHRTKTGKYDLKAGLPMRRLTGQTLGLVGFGRIARALLPKAQAVGLKTIACTPSGDDYGTGCRMVGFEELLAESDFVSLHVPLGEETRHLFSTAEFRRMKRSAFFINTARGGVVDHEALWSAIRGGEVAGAALDVFEPEPPDLSHPLFQDERVIATPHAAFISEESLHEVRSRTARQVVDVLQGRRPEHVVNPHVYDNPA